MKLRDYKEEGLFDNSKANSFAIELEIGKTFFEKEIQCFHPDRIRESRNIIELKDLHLRDKKTISKVYNKCKEYYKDKLPLWRNGCNSWGVHFHIFWDFEELKGCHDDINSLLINCPFFMKLHNGSIYNRDNSHHHFYGASRFEMNSKSRSITFNSIGSFEFRCNNVIDGRLLGYYQWILLAAKKGIKFEEVSNNIVEYAKKWDDKEYGECDDGDYTWLKWTKYEEMVTDIPIKDCKWVKLSQENKNIILRNVEKIATLLKEEGLTNSSKAFGEYLDEFNF